MSVTTAAILAAGIGSRLRPITTKLPKCMVKVSGKPIIGHQLEAFKKAGITDIKIVVGYEAQSIIDFCNDFPGLSFEFIQNTDYESNNNMYSMYMLRDKLMGKPFIFCNADVVYDPFIISKMVYQPPGNYIATDFDTYDSESMKVTLSTDGFINGIRKSFDKEESIGRAADLYRLSSEGSEKFFDHIVKIIEGERNIREWTEVVIDRLSSTQEIIFEALNIHGYRWVEIDNYDDLSVADRYFSQFDISNYKVFFLDIDGTLALGDQIIEGADGFIQSLKNEGKDYYFVSNNSSKSKGEYVTKLKRLGIEANPSQIILSTDGMIKWLNSQSISRVYCLGTESMKDELLQAGIAHVEDEPEHVVIGYDTELSYIKLVEACMWVNKGVQYSATHPDIVCPTPLGPVPDIGTMITMIEMTTGRKPKQIFGKPGPTMLNHLVGDRYLPKESVVVGDRLYTDKKLADRLGIDFVCVLSGETKREDLQCLDKENWPMLVIPRIAEIHSSSGE